MSETDSTETSSKVERYGNEAKEIQLKAVMDLVERKNSFVLAGTGFGKTRIAEMYWHLFPKGKKATVLCLNPLDSLGDNQSPEVLLNNQIFHEVFCNTKFCNRLVLTVVDEAHMVYVWGLVASGAAKKIKSHLQQ
ncbi:hypothetical protein PCANC_19801 [Puccinia coronata f. sp. avenae]|uniref:DNA 3'-5' helicase n=1 Tax=Puccinia coronata f. sp. avenae TaxID=200324 RepID=A0A2N5UPT1_9BASI|nr:hypothetical protein PCANC_19801 [Puccinia coronata f. sp. avenae]